MSGVDGLRSWGMQLVRWGKKESNRVRQVFCQPSIYGSTVVGVISAGTKEIQLVLMQAEAGGWRVAHSVQELITAPELGMGAAVENFRDAFADTTSLRLAQLGWMEWPRVFIIPEDEVIGYKISLPAGMEEAEKVEAAYWELEARLSEQGIDIGQCQTVTAELKESGDSWIAAVQQEDLQLWQQTFAEAEIPLQDLVVMSPVWPDLFVEARIPGKGFCSLLQAAPAGKNQCWNYRALAAGWLALALLVLSGFTGWDCWQLHAARQETDRLQQTMSQLAPDQQRMERLESVRQDIDARGKELRVLSERNFPWYSVLIHFGSMTTEGAWLDSLKLEGGDTLKLQGHAVNFEALADYIKAFEQDKAFFPQGPVLESSGTDKDSIVFRMTLHL